MSKQKVILIITIALILSVEGLSQSLELPPNGVLVGEINQYNHSSAVRDLGAGDQVEISVTEHEEIGEALKVSILKTSITPGIGDIKIPLHKNVKKGDILLWKFYFRSPWSEDESGDGKLVLNILNPELTNPKEMEFSLAVGEVWQEIILPFKAPIDLPARETEMLVSFGFTNQSIEISEIELYNYGSSANIDDFPVQKSTYRGRGLNAEWRKEAADRIERHRKSDLEVTVINKRGKPVKNAEVQINMTGHTFGFGSATNVFYMFGDERNQVSYRDTFLAYFNKTATEKGLRWENWFMRTPEEREELRILMDSMFAWFDEHNIPVRGHALAWAKLSKGKQPEYLLDNTENLKEEYLVFQDWQTRWVGERVVEWDAINHIVGDLVGPGRTYAHIYGMEIWADFIKRARETAPGVEMWINEGAILPRGRRIDAYLEIVELLIENSATPDGIGFMGHFREGSLTPPDEVYRRLDLYAKHIPSLQITELDVEVGNDEQLQADYFRDILTICYSHPAMKAIILWGFWEGRHWRSDAALWREDWSIKPAGQVWKDLIFDEWWTNETSKTDGYGKTINRVFNGNYEIIIDYKGKQYVERLTVEDDFTIEIIID
jgi:endo-1,4-beta-xylanase